MNQPLGMLVAGQSALKKIHAAEAEAMALRETHLAEPHGAVSAQCAPLAKRLPTDGFFCSRPRRDAHQARQGITVKYVPPAPIAPPSGDKVDDDEALAMLVPA